MSEKVIFDNGSSTYVLEHWFVGEGVAVVEGQDLSMVRADGILEIVHAPMSGIFLAKRVADGESFKAQESIGLILSHGEAGDLKVRDKLTQQDRRILDSLHSIREPEFVRSQPVHFKATPSARRIARKNKIDLNDIIGSGPDGRIQLRDIRTYIKMQNKEAEAPKEKENAVYNLPLTPLAQHLVKKHGIDASKIPAPPGATRTRKSDVERYLNNPEEAARIIEDEIAAQQKKVEDLAQPLVELLDEEETKVVPEEPWEINLEEPVETRPEEESVSEERTEVIPEESAEIFEKTEEEPYLKTSELLELEDNSEDRLLIEEHGENYKEDIIRLSTEEPVSIASDEPIELSGEIEKRQVSSEYVEPQAKETRVSGKRMIHLSAISIFDLKKIHFDLNEDLSSVDYTSRTILTRIYETLIKSYPEKLIGYIDDISEKQKYSLKINENKLEISKSPVGVKRGELLIVDLLFDGLSEVSGLVDNSNRIVLYYSYLSQLADYIDNVDESKSIIGLTLEFDSNILSPKHGLNILRSVKRALEE